MNRIKSVTQSSFEREVLQSARPVLIDFYADWCGPCRMLAPTLERLATEFAGRADIVKVNVDSESRLAEAFEVRSIPTLALMVNGQCVGKTSGLASESAIRQILDRYTAASQSSNRQVG